VPITVHLTVGEEQVACLYCWFVVQCCIFATEILISHTLVMMIIKMKTASMSSIPFPVSNVIQTKRVSYDKSISTVYFIVYLIKE
jgi:hypothetical protein